MRILGLILAGGRARRMGGDKVFAELGGAPLLAHAIARLGPQCDALALNANDDPGRFGAFGLPVVADAAPDFPGPLAGVLAGLDHARAHGFDALVSAPVDTPFLPRDLVARLGAAQGDSELAVAASGGRRHHVVALWPVRLAERLRRILLVDGERRMETIVDRFANVSVEWPIDPFDPFFNVNAPEDLARAEDYLRLP